LDNFIKKRKKEEAGEASRYLHSFHVIKALSLSIIFQIDDFFLVEILADLSIYRLNFPVLKQVILPKTA
jgi:hypothetical protein